MTVNVAALNAALDGRYIVERELGHGGMATVYLADDVRHHRKVAIKVLRAELAAVIGAERFVREIQTIATLQHPHILGLIDSGEVQGTAYYVMPFVEGESLRDRLARDKQLPIEDAIRIAAEVASALDYAHRRGIIHRDIKPENILLHDGSALVADFGIALAASSASTRMTETGMSLGTPHYMSPEQAMGERELGPRSDVYALGCVLYEMLLGEPPFTGVTAQAIIARVLTDTPRLLIPQRKSVPPHVQVAVLKALEKLPADRFGTAREFADALTGRAAIDVSTSTPASPSALLGARISNRALTVAIAAVSVAGVASYMIGARQGRNQNIIPVWTGELLGGSPTALGPRVSPDGQTIAFQAMIDGQTQVAVLKPGTGDWSVLTHDRTRGIAGEIAWSRDGTRIYYSRFFEVPRGVWSISPVGGDERLVLEDAGNPEPLPDGSLLVSRVNADHRFQLFRYFPENGRLDTLGATAAFNWNNMSFRAFPDGKRVTFVGRDARDTTTALRIMEIESGESRILSRDPLIGRGISISPDEHWVIAPRLAGNLTQFVALTTDGSAPDRVLFSATAVGQGGHDTGPDGSLYFSDAARPLEVHRYGQSGTSVVGTQLYSAVLQTGSIGESALLPLPGGRVLVQAASSGRLHIMLHADGKAPVRFVQTEDQTSFPMAMLGRDHVVVLVDGADGGVIATVAVATGRIVKRFRVANTGSVAGSRDAQTIFFVRDAVVWSLDVATGKEQRITTGNVVAAAPVGNYLVVERVESSGVRMFRVPLDGTPEQEIPIRGDLRLAPGGLAPNAIGPDGRITFQAVSPASWFWPAAIVDPKTGRIELTPAGPGFDMTPGWADDGVLVTSASALQSRMWRLKPAGERNWWRR